MTLNIERSAGDRCHGTTVYTHTTASPNFRNLCFFGFYTPRLFFTSSRTSIIPLPLLRKNDLSHAAVIFGTLFFGRQKKKKKNRDWTASLPCNYLRGAGAKAQPSKRLMREYWICTSITVFIKCGLHQDSGAAALTQLPPRSTAGGGGQRKASEREGVLFFFLCHQIVQHKDIGSGRWRALTWILCTISANLSRFCLERQPSLQAFDLRTAKANLSSDSKLKLELNVRKFPLSFQVSLSSACNLKDPLCHIYRDL